MSFYLILFMQMVVSMKYVISSNQYLLRYERAECLSSGAVKIITCEAKRFNRTIKTLELEFRFNKTNVLSVNISNTWTLPQEGFSVFYRFFRDKISWFEADAVCQFHHANLVTVENGVEFDATRAFLKELDVTEPVWIGLMRPQNSQRFIWTNTKPLDTSSGYWAESIPVLESPLCSVIDPVRDFRWHALRCGGPETAAFLCEMNLPDWAQECTISSLPSLTVQYMSDSGTIQLSRDCGEEGTRHILCKGKQDRSTILKELVCLDESKDAAVSDNAVIETTTDSGRKLPTELLTPLSEIEDNHIHLSQENNRIDLTMLNTNKIYDSMQGDQPFKSEEETGDVDLKKKIEPNAKKSTNIYKKKGKADKKSKDSEEMMMGDQPIHHHIPNVEEVPDDIQPESSEVEILPHEKKMLSQDLRTPEEMKSSIPVPVSTESSEIIEPLTADTTIVSQSTFVPTSDKVEIDTETDVSSKQTTYITSTTTMVSTTQDQRQRRRSGLELDSTTVELESTTENSVPSSTTEATQETSPDDVEHISEGTTTTTEIPLTTTTLPPMTTKMQKINVHEDGRFGSGHPIHIPKNILTKNDLITTSSPFASSTSHPIPKPTQRRDLSEEHFIPPMLLVKAQFTSTKSHDVAATTMATENLNSETTINVAASTSSATVTTLNGSEPTEIIVNEKSYSMVENGSVVDVVELSEKLNQTEQPIETLGSSSTVIILTESQIVTTHLPSSIEEILVTEKITPELISGTDELPIVTSENIVQSSQLKLNEIISHSTPGDLIFNSVNTITNNNNEHSDEQQSGDHLNMTDHEKYENKFSNVENFQPYRPNRHRSLTKPETQSMIKKILG